MNRGADKTAISGLGALLARQQFGRVQPPRRQEGVLACSRWHGSRLGGVSEGVGLLLCAHGPLGRRSNQALPMLLQAMRHHPAGRVCLQRKLRLKSRPAGAA